MPYLNLSNEEWLKAKKFFEKYPNRQKMTKSKGDLKSHSFVKFSSDLENDLYAVSNAKCLNEGILGEGNFGIVKIGKNKKGHSIAIKKIGLSEENKEELESELEIMNIVQELIGIAKKQYKVAKFDNKMQKEIKEKVYIGTPLRKGTEFFNSLQAHVDASNELKRKGIKYKSLTNAEKRKRHLFTEIDKVRLALKACGEIQRIHNLGIIHADIKPENIMADFSDSNITLKLIDFGFGAKMRTGNFLRVVLDSEGTPVKRGSPGYIAPEIYTDGYYSTASDVYALGKMFAYLELSSGILNTNKMTSIFKLERPHLLNIIINLVVTLEKQLEVLIEQNPRQDEAVQKEIKAIQEDIESHNALIENTIPMLSKQLSGFASKYKEHKQLLEQSKEKLKTIMNDSSQHSMEDIGKMREQIECLTIELEAKENITAVLPTVIENATIYLENFKKRNSNHKKEAENQAIPLTIKFQDYQVKNTNVKNQESQIKRPRLQT